MRPGEVYGNLVHSSMLLGGDRVRQCGEKITARIREDDVLRR